MVTLVVPQDDTAKKVGKMLESVLTSRGMNATDLARLVGRSQPTVWRWVNGEAFPDRESIGLIQRALGLRRGTIYRWAGEVDDSGLVDLSAVDPRAQAAIRAILREYNASTVVEDGRG